MMMYRIVFKNGKMSGWDPDYTDTMKKVQLFKGSKIEAKFFEKRAWQITKDRV